ncbi:hypothetical protein M885DRAFT_605341 [Pelagophyceae sp. CCMP2097]|nr:hypothetical protein M885DRAFT_605341 [Pelagophyceae sp. CCMP2097]
MPPSKTDTTGEKGFIKYLPVDSHPESVSGGKAICDVLKYEAEQEADETLPLFLDPATGKQVTYQYATTELKRLLHEAGFPELASGSHSLRIGGATTAANVSTDVVAGFVGCWSSDAKYGYFWAMRGRIGRVSVEMGRAAADEATHRHCLTR